MRGVRKTAVAHSLREGLRRAGDRTAFGQEILDELRPAMTRVQAKEIVQYQHLSIAGRSGADADGGN